VSASDRDGGLPPSPPKPLANLQNQVITAVRGAISDAMAGHEAEHDLSGLDLDFSVPAVPAPPAQPTQPPVLRAEPGRALTAPAPALQGQKRGWLTTGLVTLAAIVGLAAGIAFGILREPPASDPVAPSLAAPAKPLQPASPVLPVLAVPAAPKAALPQAAPPAAAQTAAAPPPPVRSTLDAARGLVADGHVARARELLLPEAAATEHPEAALLLARCFDPNYLATLPRPDAAPDAAEARRWYTRWYDLASKRGEVPPTMRLDLLLRSLDAK